MKVILIECIGLTRPGYDNGSQAEQGQTLRTSHTFGHLSDGMGKSTTASEGVQESCMFCSCKNCSYLSVHGCPVLAEFF